MTSGKGLLRLGHLGLELLAALASRDLPRCLSLGRGLSN